MEVLFVLCSPISRHLVLACLGACIPLIGCICIILCALAATRTIIPVGIHLLAVGCRRFDGVIYLLGVAMTKSVGCFAFFNGVSAVGANQVAGISGSGAVGVRFALSVVLVCSQAGSDLATSL